MLLLLLLVAPFALGEGKKSMISHSSILIHLLHVFIRWRIFHWWHFPSDCLKPCDSGALYSGNWSTTVRLSIILFLHLTFLPQFDFIPISRAFTLIVFGLFLYCVKSSLIIQVSGRTCQTWAKDSPHSHNYNDQEENFCRSLNSLSPI